MLSSRRKPMGILSACLRHLLPVAMVVAPWTTAYGQFFQQAVGGISINAKGVLSNAEKDHNGLRQFWLDNRQPVAGDLNQPAKLRKISLRALEEALATIVREEGRLPDDMRFLAGLQRIEYVLVYPEQHDIVLAGYAEGWEVDARGNMVGVTTGRPVMQLDDLLIALRTAEEAARGGILCSIDPTEEGLARIRNVGPTPVSPFAGAQEVAEAAADAIARELGPHNIRFGGVPPESRFAHVLLAADYRMKRLGMNFDPSPVKGLSSYLQMIKSTSAAGNQNMLPRWWLTTNYLPLLTDRDGLAWQLRGQGVKAMSENDFLGADGRKQQTGKASPLAQKWADQMTKKYDELSVKEPIFGELRNCIDLAVVAALIVKENLVAKAAIDLATLLSADRFPTHVYKTPKQVDSKASVVAARDGYILSASGGVEINSWAEASRKETSDELASIRAKVTDGRGRLWWWN
ncbi:MAG TPA: DUF1598 domain-containing protein [Pirellulales bacterium]|jgi:hypothetical protein|nr:DUF1598 domain-containing protein [Pirellulales bacterium]